MLNILIYCINLTNPVQLYIGAHKIYNSIFEYIENLS